MGGGPHQSPHPRNQATTATTQRPEEVRVRARIRDHERAVRQHDARGEQVRGARAEELRECAVAAAEPAAADADAVAGAAHDEPPVLLRRRVELAELDAGADRDGRKRRLRRAARARPRRREGNFAELVRPHEQPSRRRRSPIPVVAGGLHGEPQVVLRREEDGGLHVSLRLGHHGEGALRRAYVPRPVLTCV